MTLDKVKSIIEYRVAKAMREYLDRRGKMCLPPGCVNRQTTRLLL